MILQDEPEIRNRVKLAFGLLIGAKVLNVSVPFLFKYAVDEFSTGGAALATAPETVATFGTALLVGCETLIIILNILNNEQIFKY